MKRLGHRSLLTLLLGLFLLGCLQASILRAQSEERPAAGEAKGGESHEGRSAVFKWINFAILVAGLGYVLRKPLAQFFSDRSAAIEKSLSEGRKALEAAEAQLHAVELKLQNLEAEMAAFRASALKEMEEEHAHLRETAAQEAGKILDAVRVQMDVAGKQARLELRLHAARLAVEMAEQMIARRMDPPTQARLVSQFAERLKV